MILMALDHTRDFFGSAANPVNIATTTPALFFTRWITHFCAPTFFLLMGTGAYLSLARKSTGELSRFLFTRGVWLIFLELVVVRGFGLQFNFDFRASMLLILWALGCAMITLAVLVWLPMPAIAAIGLLMIAGHNAFDSVQSANPLWVILHSPNILLEGRLFDAYPLIPWVAVTAVGFALGPIYRWEPARRRAFLLYAGIAATLAFVALRAANIYGNPFRWSTQGSAIFTVLSFLNTNKQPPSLLYLLMTLGPVMLFLRAIDGRTPAFLRPALVFGKVPMFYFLLHLFLIHALAVIVCGVRYGAVHWMFESPDLANFPFTRPPDWGYSLPVVYAVWVFVVASLYPLCRWYAQVKRQSKAWWLSYL